MKQKNQNKPWTPEDTHLVMTSKLNMEKIAKKLKRTKQACSMRRYKLKQANADQYTKVQKQAKDVVIQANDTLAIIKKRRVIKKPSIGAAIDKPVLKVKSYQLRALKTDRLGNAGPAKRPTLQTVLLQKLIQR